MVVDATALMMGSRGRPTLEASEKGPHPYLFRALERAYNAGIRSGSSKPLPTKNDATCRLTSINSARGGSSSRESNSTNTEDTVCRDHRVGLCCSSSSSVSTSVAHSTSSTATGFASRLSAHAHNSHSNSREAPAPRRTCLPSFPPTRIRPVTNPDRRRLSAVRHTVSVFALP